MSDLASLSAKKLHQVVARCEARWSEVVDAAIAAGMGHISPREMVELAKGSSLSSKACLARDYLNALQDRRVVLAERDRRQSIEKRG